MGLRIYSYRYIHFRSNRNQLLRSISVDSDMNIRIKSVILICQHFDAGKGARLKSNFPEKASTGCWKTWFILFCRPWWLKRNSLLWTPLLFVPGKHCPPVIFEKPDGTNWISSRQVNPILGIYWTYHGIQNQDKNTMIFFTMIFT